MNWSLNERSLVAIPRSISKLASEPTSIEKVTRRAGKSLEMRESYSDRPTLFGPAHRSTSQSEQQRYIPSEEDVRGPP